MNAAFDLAKAPLAFAKAALAEAKAALAFACARISCDDQILLPVELASVL